jgi:LPS sulfotransferase NodH
VSRPFILFFTERSGSSSVMFDIERHPKAVVHMEMFGERELPTPQAVMFDLEAAAKAKIMAGPSGTRGVSQTDDNRLLMLDEMFAGYLNPGWLRPEFKGCARGFKVQFKREGVQFDEPPRLAQALEPYQPVVIALRRTDILRQAISKVRSWALAEINAGEWGVWDQHIKPQSGPRARSFADQPIEIAPEVLETQLQIIEANNADLEAFLELAPPAVEITYEDYLVNRLAVLNRILNAIGLAPFDEEPPTTVQKITSPELSAAVANHEEIRRFAADRGLQA